MGIRDKIIEGAAELFRIYGIRSVTMDSIASHLGISKRTIYEVFSDKDDLLIGVFNRMNEKQKEVLKSILTESENSIVAIFRLLEINQLHFQQMSPAFYSDIKRFHYEQIVKNTNKGEMPDLKNTQQLIEQGIEEKLFRKEINADLINRCLYMLVRNAMDNDLFPFEKYSRKEVLKSTFINYLKGVSTSKGLKLISALEKNF
jgi:AcrR family transcriptional regulator